MFLFRGCNLLDPVKGELREGVDILVEGDRFKEVADRPIKSAGATVIDVGGRTVMPGLIDAHIHVYLSEVNLQLLDAIPLTLMAGRAATLMRAMIDRGFTTVRDTGGADWGIREAVESGHLVGPRLFIAGRAITQTGGHGDFRRRHRCRHDLRLLPAASPDLAHRRRRAAKCCAPCATSCARAPTTSS